MNKNVAFSFFLVALVLYFEAQTVTLRRRFPYQALRFLEKLAWQS